MTMSDHDKVVQQFQDMLDRAQYQEPIDVTGMTLEFEDVDDLLNGGAYWVGWVDCE